MPKLSASLGQPIVIENRGGAGGLVGTAYVAKLPADGYTWLFTTASHVNIPPFNENANYDPVRDFTHVTLAAQNFGQALVVHPDVPAKNLQELIAYASKNPGKLTYANAGNGTASHIPAEVMKSMTGTDILSVPYKGIPPVVAAALSGEVEVASMSLPPAVQLIKSGKLIGLAVTSGKRNQALPDVPTIAETGFPGFEDDSWVGAWVPAGTPAAVVKRLRDELEKAALSNDVKQLLRNVGFEASPLFGEPFSLMVKKELGKWEKVVKETDTKVE